MRKRLVFCGLFASFVAMWSCAKDEAHVVRCSGDNCSKETSDYPVCEDEDTLIVSEDGSTVPCPNGCADGQCLGECSDGMTKCLSDKVLQRCVDGSWKKKECEGLCAEDKCIASSPSCKNKDLRCSGSDVEICQDGEWTHSETCSFECLEGQCVLCHEGDLRCSGSDAEICHEGQWTLSETCPIECLDGQCILCHESDLRCSGSDVEICHEGQWTFSENCPNECLDGQCILCREEDRRCSDLDVEICLRNEWTISENCPYECRDGVCTDDCDGEDICRDEKTLQQCINNKWKTKVCGSGCKDGKCKPQEKVDHRVTNKICSEDGYFGGGFCDDLYKEGAVCVDFGPTSAWCFARCDPKKPKKYYCESTLDAYQGNCVKISDGSYALIPTHVDSCKKSCSSSKGCDKITDSVDVHPQYCDEYENYCEGTIKHYCENTMKTYDCSQDGQKCAQSGSLIWCTDSDE